MEYAQGREPGEIGKEFCSIAQYFAIGKAHRGGNHYGRGAGNGSGTYGKGEGQPSPPPTPTPLIRDSHILDPSSVRNNGVGLYEK